MKRYFVCIFTVIVLLCSGCKEKDYSITDNADNVTVVEMSELGQSEILTLDVSLVSFRFLYKGIIIKHNKTEPTYTKTSLFLCEKRRFFMARTKKGGKSF